MHFKPLKIFSFQTVFLFTLKFDYNFDSLKLRFLQFLFYFFTQNCMILMFYFIGIGKNVDIYPKAGEDKNRTKFFEDNFNPLKCTFLRFFKNNHGQN